MYFRGSNLLIPTTLDKFHTASSFFYAQVDGESEIQRLRQW